MSWRAQSLARVTRNVADMDRAVAFYRDALGFTVDGAVQRDDPIWAAALDLPGAHADAVRLHLGGQAVELRVFDPPGRAYPLPSGAADVWFQHLAIVVADMDAAYAHLRRFAFIAISTAGPETLPPNTGAVRAFKFRDPDGHPLELIAFPPGVGDPAWQSEADLFLGIDHSAISVPDLSAAVDFFSAELGFSVAVRSLNRGPEQARLDGAADACVDVVALQPVRPGPPHVELLAYRQPQGRAFPVDSRANDVLADRLVLRVDALGDAHTTAQADGHARVALRSPGGHFLSLSDS